MHGESADYSASASMHFSGFLRLFLHLAIGAAYE
jgi:hypothetical protein